MRQVRAVSRFGAAGSGSAPVPDVAVDAMRRAEAERDRGQGSAS